MNVIPPVPKGGNKGPIGDEEQEPVRRASRGIEIEDMTPPMHRTGSTGPDIEQAVPTGNQIAAMVADAVARLEVDQIAPLQRQIDRIFENIDQLADVIKAPGRAGGIAIMDHEPGEPVAQPAPKYTSEPGTRPPTRGPDDPAFDNTDLERTNQPTFSQSRLAEMGYTEANAPDHLLPTDMIEDRGPSPPAEQPAEAPEPGPTVEPDLESDTGDRPERTINKAFVNQVMEEIEQRLREVAATALLSINGAPSLYKGIYLRGYKRATPDDDWTEMTVQEELAAPPTKLEAEAGDTDLTCLRLTWDWQRIQP